MTPQEHLAKIGRLAGELKFHLCELDLFNDFTIYGYSIPASLGLVAPTHLRSLVEDYTTITFEHPDGIRRHYKGEMSGIEIRSHELIQQEVSAAVGEATLTGTARRELRCHARGAKETGCEF